MSLWEKQILCAALIFIRASTLIIFVPFLGGNKLPAMLRVSLAFGLAWILYAQVSSGDLPKDAIGLALLALKEGAVGFLMGLAVYLVFFAVEFSMQIAANEMGFSMSTVLDPSAAKPQNILESLFVYVVSLVFLITNTHQTIILAFKKSFEFFPIGIEVQFKGFSYLIEATAKVFVLGLQIAAPIVAMNFLINIAFFVLGKAAPKINIFLISFSARILCGLTLLMFVMQLLFQYIYREALHTPQRMLEILLY